MDNRNNAPTLRRAHDSQRCTCGRTPPEKRAGTEAFVVIFFDKTGTVIDGNDVFLRMTGYTREEIESRQLTWRRLTPPEWVKVSEEQLEKLAATGWMGPYEKEYLCKDGSRRWMLFSGRDLGDGSIAPSSGYCFVSSANRIHSLRRLTADSNRAAACCFCSAVSALRK